VLLRRNWSRLIGGAGCLLVASYYGYIVIRGILHGSKTVDIIYLSLIVIGLGLFGYHLLVSKRIKQFMGHE
jgi:cell division protein FtsW (lipid II flippase)